MSDSPEDQILAATPTRALAVSDQAESSQIHCHRIDRSGRSLCRSSGRDAGDLRPAPAACENAFCYGTINHGVKYLNGSGAMTQPQGGNE
jgi:hypothetical protein